MFAISREFLAAIGAVTVEFANLENDLEQAIWSLLVGTSLEHQALGRIVTSDLSFRRKLDLFEALLKHRAPKRDNADLRKLRNRLLAVEQERNNIVHSTWGTAAANDMITRIKTTAKRELKPNSTNSALMTCLRSRRTSTMPPKTLLISILT